MEQGRGANLYLGSCFGNIYQIRAIKMFISYFGIKIPDLNLHPHIFKGIKTYLEVISEWYQLLSVENVYSPSKVSTAHH